MACPISVICASDIASQAMISAPLLEKKVSGSVPSISSTESVANCVCLMRQVPRHVAVQWGSRDGGPWLGVRRCAQHPNPPRRINGQRPDNAAFSGPRLKPGHDGCDTYFARYQSHSQSIQQGVRCPEWSRPYNGRSTPFDPAKIRTIWVDVLPSIRAFDCAMWWQFRSPAHL